jgi:hypothetical protein
MPWYRIAVGVALCLFLHVSSASAILLESGGVRVSGYLVREDDRKVIIRTQNNEGQETVHEYNRAKIKILHQVDGKRLEALSPDNPKGYRDYADELARQEADPEAKYLARRLYLLAAGLDPGKYAVSSLLRMSALAETPAEARRCRALAYLLDKTANDRLLVQEDARTEKPGKAQAEALQNFTKALQSYRVGKLQLAIEITNRKGLEQVFRRAPGGMDQKTFRRLCLDARCQACAGKGNAQCATCSGKGFVRNPFGGTIRCSKCSGKKFLNCEACDGRGANPDHSEDTLRLLLGAELWATEQLAGGEAASEKNKPDEKKSWSVVLQKRQFSPVLPLTLDNITEFDPRKSQYRQGRWVVPTEKGKEK